jgi:DNA replication licensing factor MCM4
VERFREIAADKALYDVLVGSLAPSIWEMDDIKKGVLCLLFGGANQDGAGQVQPAPAWVGYNPGEGTRKEKSERREGPRLSPLTPHSAGYVTKDPETRDMVLESGALVRSARGALGEGRRT